MNIPQELLTISRRNVETVNLPSDNNHDPSNILYVNGKYYLWYTQHLNGLSFDHYVDCKIMCRTSKDGYNWTNAQDALLPSEDGWDCCGVLTANVVMHEGRYYMFYTGVGVEFAEGRTTKRCCGIAVSNSPDGLFSRIGTVPILQWGEDGSWDDEAVDDVSAIYWNGRWMLYYKGSTLADQDADHTLLGLACADEITGPYIKVESNPLIRGHAFSIWSYKDGLCLLTGLKHNKDEGSIYAGNWDDSEGVQYLYYSDNGIYFEPCASFNNRASGIYTPEGEAGNDIRNYWGISVATRDRHLKRYIERFNFQ